MPRRPARRAAPLALGVACLLVPAWVAATRWTTLAAGHLAYPVLLGALVLLGAALLGRARRPRRAGRLRATGRAVGAVAVVAALGLVAWLRPYPAQPVAVAATASSPTVQVVDGATRWELRPRGARADVGVLFLPGALVDPRAYLALLRPLAQRGHLVVVVKPPLDIALLASTDGVLDAHPEVGAWAVGGHSLGGVAAATEVSDPRVRGVFFWASYPSGDLSSAPLAAASVSGDQDALSSPAEVEASRALLPPGAAFTVVPGAVHAFFGDYGPQAGDGTPRTSRAEAQEHIVAATQDFVTSLGGG